MATAREAFALVLMPSSERSTRLYADAIKPGCEDAGVTCERADERHFVESILHNTSDEILAVDVIIADVTERNAGIFYEIGYAHAFGRPTLILTARSSDVPPHLQRNPIIVYDDDRLVVRDEVARQVT